MTVEKITRAGILEIVASKRVSHPVATVLDREQARIQAISDQANSMHSAEGTRFIYENLGFLADTLAGLEEFSLKPSDIVAIGVRLDQLPRLHTLDVCMRPIATALCAAYAIQGTDNRLWVELPKQCLVGMRCITNYLPSAVMDDRDGLLYVKERLMDINHNLDELWTLTYAEDKTRIPAVDNVCAGMYSAIGILKLDITGALSRFNQTAI